MPVENINIALKPYAQIADHVHRYYTASHILPRKGLVYDLGCGYGYGTQILQKFPKRRLVGVDHNAEAIAFAQKTYPASHTVFEAKDVETYPIEPDSTVVCLEVVEHLVHPGVFIEKIQAQAAYIALSAPIIPTKHRNPYHLHDFTARQIQAWFEGGEIKWEICHFELQAQNQTLFVVCRKM